MPTDAQEAAKRMAHVVAPDMARLREVVDGAETLCAKELWPFPSYTDILYSVK